VGTNAAASSRYHQLVHLDGTPIDGEPMLATAGW